MNTPLPIPTASAHTRSVRKRKRKECRKDRQAKVTPKKQRNVSTVTGTRHVDVDVAIAAPGGVVTQPTQPSTTQPSESIPPSVARVATRTQAVLVTQSSQESFSQSTEPSESVPPPDSIQPHYSVQPSTIQPIASASVPGFAPKNSAGPKKSLAHEKHKLVHVTDLTVLHWLRSRGPEPSAPTLSSNSLKKTARYQFMPIKRKNRTIGSSEGQTVRSLRSNSQSAISDLPVSVGSIHNDEQPNQLTAPVVSNVRRLLIEDIMTLPANLAKPFVLCFNESAPNFQTLHIAMSQLSSPLPLLFFEAHRFFQIRVTVDLNGRVGNMVDGVLARPDFLHLMFGNGNEQITFLLYDINHPPPDRSALATACSFTFLWRDFFEHKLSLLLFGNVPFRRQFYEALNNLSAFDSRITLFRQLADEVRFDCSLSFALCSAYERVITHQSKGNGKSDAGSFKSLLDKGLTGDALTELELDVNASICSEVLLCYGSFSSWTDSVLPDAVLDRLVQRAFDLVPNLMNVIMYMLGTLQKENIKRKQHLLVYYRRMAFFELMALARLRNRQRFIWWSVINTAIYYQADAQSLVSNVTKLFGITCTFGTLMDKTLPMTEEASFRLRVLEALNNEVVEVCFAPAELDNPTPVPQRFKFVIMVFDNTQKNYPLKWQRGGRTSYFLKLTSRMFWKLNQGFWKTQFVPQQHVPLSYVEQVIPSAFGMPPWEVFDISTSLTDLLVSPHQLKLPPNLLLPPTTIDFTGKRVCAHERLVLYAASCRSLYRHLSLANANAYEFRPSVMSSSPTVALVSERLSTCRGVGGLLRTSPSFQQRMVSVYRPSTPKLALLVLPVLKFD